MITTIDDYSCRCEQKEEGEEPSPQKAITDASTAGLGLVLRDLCGRFTQIMGGLYGRDYNITSCGCGRW